MVGLNPPPGSPKRPAEGAEPPASREAPGEPGTPGWESAVKLLQARKAREPGVNYILTDEEGTPWTI